MGTILIKRELYKMVHCLLALIKLLFGRGARLFYDLVSFENDFPEVLEDFFLFE